MPQQFINADGDVVEADGVLTGFLEARGYTPVAEVVQEAAEQVAEVLKGQALDDALNAAGLARTGSADEKRARYAEWLAGQNNPDPDTGSGDTPEEH